MNKKIIKDQIVERYQGIISIIVTVLTSFVLIYIVLVYAQTFAAGRVLGGDALSWVVQAVAPIKGFGQPYVDYWDIKPPGLILLTQLWVALFGYGMSSLKVLNVALSLGVSALLYLINRKLFPWWFSAPFTILVAIILFSPAFQTVFLASEMYGLFVSLLGLYVLLRAPQSNIAVGLATFCLVFSGQIKDPYLLTVLAVIPVLLVRLLTQERKKWLLAMVAVTVGGLLAYAVTYVYLWLVSAVSTYSQVMAYKSAEFRIWNMEVPLSRVLPFLQRIHETFAYPQYFSLLVPVISFCLVLFSLVKMKKLKVSAVSEVSSHLEVSFHLTKKHLLYLICLAYIVGSLLGFAMQGKLGFHYYIQIVYPFWLLLALSFWIGYSSLAKAFFDSPKALWTRVILFVLLLLPVIPKPTYLKTYLVPINPLEITQLIAMDTREEDISLERLIAKRSDPDDCVFGVYGWHLGGMYLYSNRKPCSPYFILNIATDQQKDEIVTDLLNQPPAAIQYLRGYEDAIDVPEFESKYFDFPIVLEKCYDIASPSASLFFPKPDLDLKACVAEHFSNNE